MSCRTSTREGHDPNRACSGELPQLFTHTRKHQGQHWRTWHHREHGSWRDCVEACNRWWRRGDNQINPTMCTVTVAARGEGMSRWAHMASAWWAQVRGRLEVVVNGLPLFSGSQIAMDTTLVSARRSDGTPLRQAAAEDGVALTAAALRKSRTYPELVGPRARARLVVMGVEVGGRWAPETRTFLSLLARRERGVSAGCYSEQQIRRGV